MLSIPCALNKSVKDHALKIMKEIIHAKSLRKSYDAQGEVLRGIDISIRPGEFLAIMGPSGCGKSTLLHLLGMLHYPDSGELRILGQDVTRLSQDASTIFRREHMGFILQSNNMFPHTTVYENLEFPLIYSKIPKNRRRALIARALEQVRLENKVASWSNSLSGGEQQRVAIARALVNSPRIVLADEPTGALDSRNSHSLMQLFRSICEKNNVAIIMVTHDNRMAEYCDTVYRLEEGKIVI